MGAGLGRQDLVVAMVWAYGAGAFAALCLWKAVGLQSRRVGALLAPSPPSPLLCRGQAQAITGLMAAGIKPLLASLVLPCLGADRNISFLA